MIKRYNYYSSKRKNWYKKENYIEIYKVIKFYLESIRVQSVNFVFKENDDFNKPIRPLSEERDKQFFVFNVSFEKSKLWRKSYINEIFRHKILTLKTNSDDYPDLSIFF